MALIPVGDVVVEKKVRPVVDKLLPLHPDYQRCMTRRSYWCASFKGGEDYPLHANGKGKPMLWQHPREDPDTYAIRKDTANCPNFCGPIIKMFTDFVLRKPAERSNDGPPEYLDLIKNADGYDMPLSEFMETWLQKAQVERVTYCMPVNPIPDGMEIKTKAEAMSAGAKPRLMLIEADQVVNWSCRGPQLYEALVMLEIDGKPVARYLTETTRQDFALKRTPLSDRQSGGSSFTVVSGGPVLKHGYPGLPLVPLIPMPDSVGGDLPEQSQVAPLANLQQDFLNVLSWLREELWNCVFTQYWVAGARPPAKTGTGGSDNDEVKYGSNKWFWFASPDAKLNRISADPAASQKLMEQLNAIKMNIYLAAGLESEDPTKVRGDVQSGVALAFKFQNLAATLGSLAKACGTAENKLWKLLEGGWGFTIPMPTKYATDFDIPNFAEELAGLVQALATPALPSLLNEKLVDRFSKRNLNLSDEDQDELDKQMKAKKAAAEAAQQAFPPNENTGGPPLPQPNEPPTPGDKSKKK